MSTRRKKLYSKGDIGTAKEELKNQSKSFSHNTKQRKTVQVRISDKWHQKLKEVGRTEKIRLSYLLDRICEFYFKHY